MAVPERILDCTLLCSGYWPGAVPTAIPPWAQMGGLGVFGHSGAQARGSGSSEVPFLFLCGPPSFPSGELAQNLQDLFFLAASSQWPRLDSHFHALVHAIWPPPCPRSLLTGPAPSCPTALAWAVPSALSALPRNVGVLCLAQKSLLKPQEPSCCPSLYHNLETAGLLSFQCPCLPTHAPVCEPHESHPLLCLVLGSVPRV